ncbi:ABC transporter ATP-binding protein [Salibacteraceae bacterium]|nr:ABC transporter ATP-binding protein [Salibacteraceae bacterium]MDB9709331.1 ABC transporter ATP-binding protein [Salibacteraceae bacterium]
MADSNIILRVESLSKIYQLGQFGSGTISQDLNQFFNKVRGREELNRSVTSNELSTKSNGLVYALQDVNFELKRGQVVGIIGKNGAGKSTLLKVLSKVTRPSSGKIYIKGKVSSLLEVGTGFHPELTGRENIFLNGAILGMNKSEIKNKLDEIVDFSGVAKYLDTPVKRYSSGMTVRLGFAVAAHLEPDILIVDEVLAVGDAEFQKKAIGKMQEVSQDDGRTVIIVSHNLATINELCSHSLLMQAGKQVAFDETQKVLNLYTRSVKSEEKIRSFSYESEQVKCWDFSFSGDDQIYDINSRISFGFSFLFKMDVLRPLFRIDIYSVQGVHICREDFTISSVTEGYQESLKITIPKRFLNADYYYINVLLAEDRVQTLLLMKEALQFEVIPTSELAYSDIRDKNTGVVLSPLEVEISA